MFPILGHFQGFTFYTYGTVLLLSLVWIYLLAIRRLDTTLLTREQLDDLGLIILISIWVGGGIVTLLFAWSHDFTYLLENFRFEKFQQVGMLPISLSVLLLLLFYCREKNIPFFKVLDFLMPFFVLGYALQRTLGCFSAGCCYGQPSDLIWAVRFPDTLGVGPVPGIPVHPTQLYMGFTAFLTYAIQRLWQAQHPPAGTLSCIGVIGLFGFYGLTAFVRGDLTSVHHIGSFPINQLVAGLICVAGLAGLVWIQYAESKKKPGEKDPPPVQKHYLH